MNTMFESLNSEALFTILLIISLLSLPLLLIFKKLKPQLDPPLPPGPKPWPIIGTINHLLHPKTDHLSLSHLAQTYGPLMLLNLGTQRVVVASSPAAAVEVLKANDRVLSGRYIPHFLLKRDSMSFWAHSTSDYWRNLRTICRSELFTGKALQRYARVREEKAEEMVAEVRAKEGAVVNVDKIVFDTVVNMSSNAYFSRDIAAVGLDDYSPIAGILRGIGEVFNAPNLSDLYPFLGKFDLQGLRRRYMGYSMKMWDLWKPIVEERREMSELKHDDFLDTLISRGFGDDQINYLLEDLFSGGIHTTTSTIIKTIMELLKTPHAMAKLKHELITAFNGQDSTENLPYLDACIKETLRLHPPAPLMLGHRAYATCKVMNHTVPENAQVLVNVWAIGRDPAVWEEPLQYRPERFLSSINGAVIDYRGNDFELLPFGAGRRVCPGMSVAVKIVTLVVATLIYSFDWSAPVGNIDQTLMKMKGPLLLIPRATKVNE